MNKKLFIAFFAIALTSCGTTTVIKEVAPTTQVVETTIVEQTSPPTTEEVLSPEEQFVDNLMVEFSWLVNNMGRVKLVDLGKVICQAIDEGMSFSDYLEMILSYNVDAGAGGAILRESIYNFCPKEQWFLDAAIDQLSRS